MDLIILEPWYSSSYNPPCFYWVGSVELEVLKKSGGEKWQVKNEFLSYLLYSSSWSFAICLSLVAESGGEGGEEHTAQVMTGPYHQPHQPTKQEKIWRTSSSWKNATNTKY